MAKRDAAAAGARGRRLRGGQATRRFAAGSDPAGAARRESRGGEPGARAATKTSLTQRLAESTAADANANFQNSPSSSVEQISGEDDEREPRATDDDARDALGDVVAKKKKTGAKPAAETRRNPRAAPASRKQVLSEDDTRVETTVENADVPNPRHQNPRHRADPSASLTFAGATPTSWIARLLTSRMSGDPTIRAAFLCALCAVEEKRLDFAERLLTEHDFECGWRFRLLEYLDRARGRGGRRRGQRAPRAAVRARAAAAREARREREARETDALRAEEDEWRSARGGRRRRGARERARYGGRRRASRRGETHARFRGRVRPVFRRAPGRRAQDSRRLEATGEDEALGRRRSARQRRKPRKPRRKRNALARSRDEFRRSARRASRHERVRQALPYGLRGRAGVAPSGPLPLRGASGAGAGALGAAFALFAENAGAADLEDWKRMRRLAKRDAAARPPALTLTLAGLLAWRVGDLEGAKAPLRAAMHHDGVAARAAPLLFEVLLLLDETDEAEVVWDTALHRGESGPTYERLIAVALRCGEGGEGEPLGESDKRTEGDSERR